MVVLSRRKDAESHTFNSLTLVVIKASLVQILVNICSVFFKNLWQKEIYWNI